jgi:hypothetical protein
MTRLGELPPVTIVLGTAAGFGILAFLAALLPATLFVRDTVSAKSAVPNVSSLPMADIRPFEDYKEIFAKPVFNPGRQADPQPPAEAAKNQLPALSDYRLVGIVIMKDTKLGLVERRSSKQVVTVHPGDALDGRRVDDVTQDGIHLSGGATRELLAMPRVNGISRSGSKDVAARKEH